MVRKVNDKKGKSPLTKTTFLASLDEFYPDGVHVEVANVSNVFENKLNNNKPSIFVTLRIVSEMARCYAYALDEDGNYITTTTQLGKEEKKIVTIDATDQEVGISYNLKENLIANAEDENKEYYIHPSSSLYSLIKYYFTEELGESYHNAIIVNYDDLKQLKGSEFIATSKLIKSENFKPYYVLIPKVMNPVLDRYMDKEEV